MFLRVLQPAFKCGLTLALAVAAPGFGGVSLADENGSGETALALNLGYGPPPDASKACEYAWDAAQRRAQALAYEARQLSSCAERGDFGDACVHAFWGVRNAQSDYESAVNQVKSLCA